MTSGPWALGRQALPDATLPARWKWRQRLKNTVIYGLIRAGAAFLRRVPRWLIDPLGFVLGHVAAALAGRERRRADNQLAAALPELGAVERHRVVRGVFVHLARAALDLGHLGFYLRDPDALGFDAAARQVFDAALAEGRGVVAVTGHIGNWELLAQVVAKAGYPIATIAKPLYDPRLTRWVHAERSRHGLGVIWRGAAGGAKDMLRIFRNNGILALLIDQDTRVEGAFVPFFGRPAHTPTAAAAMAVRFGAPVIMAWAQRRRGTYHIHCELLRYEKSSDPEADILSLTARMTERLEQAIRQAPEQWVWLHDRWRRAPPSRPSVQMSTGPNI